MEESQNSVEMETVNGFKSGFVAIIGKPNVGKSTLLNYYMGQKLAIISDKPQTTRNRILGVKNFSNAQIAFLDTPGIHKPKHKLGEYMVNVAERTLKEVDLVLFMVEADAPPGVEEHLIIDYLKNIKIPILLVINKVDKLNQKELLLPLIEEYNKLYKFSEIIPISALKGDNLDSLTAEMIEYLPPGVPYYPEDTITDQLERFLIGELIREKIFYLTSQEIPYSVAVTVEEMKRREERNLIYIKATIYVEKDSQKGIIIGKEGRMLKKIGELAREEIEFLIGSRTYLDVWVKVKKNWRQDSTALRQLGYE